MTTTFQERGSPAPALTPALSRDPQVEPGEARGRLAPV